MTQHRLIYAVTLTAALLAAAVQPADATPAASSFATTPAQGSGTECHALGSTSERADH